MNWTSLKKLLIEAVKVVLILEITSAALLIGWILACKVLDKNESRYKIQLFKNDLPYGIASPDNEYKSRISFNSDPHLTYYSPDLRFGESKWWLLANAQQEAEKTINIIMLGGSTVEGDGANNQEETLPAQLESYLNKNRSSSCLKIRVLNEGISGYHAKQQYLLLVYALIPQLNRKNIQMVINFDGVNDFLGWGSERDIENQSQHPFTQRLGTRELAVKSVLQEFFTTGQVKNRWGVPWLRNFYKATFTGRFVLSLHDSLLNQKNDIDLFGQRDNLSIYTVPLGTRIEDYLYWKKLMDSTLSASDIKSVQILQPYIGYKKYPTPDEKKYREFDSRFPKIFWENFDAYYNQLRKSIKHSNVVTDLSDFHINERNEVYIDHVHYNPAAQKKIAEYIGNMVRNKLPCQK